MKAMKKVTEEQILLEKFFKGYKKEYGSKCSLELKESSRFEYLTLVGDIKFNKTCFSVRCEYSKERYQFKYTSIKSFFQNACKNDESFKYFVGNQIASLPPIAKRHGKTIYFG